VPLKRPARFLAGRPTEWRKQTDPLSIASAAGHARKPGMNRTIPLLLYVAFVMLLVVAGPATADDPVLRFVSAPDLLNADVAYQAGRAFDMSETSPDYATKKQIILDARARAGLPEIPYSDSDYDHLNDVNEDGILSVQEGYRGGLQAIYEAIAAENPAFMTVSGDIIDGSYGLKTGSVVSEQADIYYGAYMQHLADAGISKMYGVIGDHEIGDNSWPSSKTALMPEYLGSYDKWMGMPSTVARGGYVDAPARYQADGRVYAVKENNTLLIGVETFDMEYDAAGNITAVYENSPGEARKRTNIEQDQLDWLTTTLAAAKADSSIDSVVVLGHMPIDDGSVRTLSTSNMRIAHGTESDFWGVLAEGEADLYIVGEVHAQSGLAKYGAVQLVGGGNFFSTNNTEYTVVDVFEDRIELTLKGVDPVYNGDRDQSTVSDIYNEDKSKTREWRIADTDGDGSVLDEFSVLGSMVIDISGHQAKVTSISGKMAKHFSDYDHATEQRVALDYHNDKYTVQEGFVRLGRTYDGSHIQVVATTNASELSTDEYAPSSMGNYYEDGVLLTELVGDGLLVKHWDAPEGEIGQIDLSVAGLAAGEYSFAGWFHNQKAAGDSAEAIVLLSEDGTTFQWKGQAAYTGGESPPQVGKIEFAFLNDGDGEIIFRVTNNIDAHVMLNGLELELLAYAGDADRDGAVAFEDAWTFLGNYRSGETGLTWADGDFNGDSIVDQTDAELLLLNWGQGMDTIGPAPEQLVALVPEPATLVVLAAGGLGALAKKRRS
jgi:hypothetical protein